MPVQKTKEIEIQDLTVEAAVREGLARLGLDENDAVITVVDEGSRGLLGIGTREAIVRVRPRDAADEVEAPPSVEVEEIESVTVEPPPLDEAASEKEPRDETVIEASEREREVAQQVIEELLEKMQVTADVAVSFSEPDDRTGRQVNEFDITGEELKVLIGSRGETLEAFQYLARLMVAHEVHRRAYFVIDVDGYRERQAQALARLAERMADKVRQRQEPISLEPMSPYERRIIHITLKDSDDVYTESSGEGKYRKVRIFPKHT